MPRSSIQLVGAYGRFRPLDRRVSNLVGRRIWLVAGEPDVSDIAGHQVGSGTTCGQPLTLPLAPLSRQDFQLAQRLIRDVSGWSMGGLVGRLVGHSSHSTGGLDDASRWLTKRSARVPLRASFSPCEPELASLVQRVGTSATRHPAFGTLHEPSERVASEPTVPNVGLVSRGSTKGFDLLEPVSTALQDAADGAEQGLVRVRHGGSSDDGRQSAAAMVNKSLLPIATCTVSAIIPLPVAHAPWLGLITSGNRNTSMPFDIFALRPKSNTSKAIRAALDKVTAAEVEQATQPRQARDERDRLLLDGTPVALAKAQAAVTAAIEPAEQTATMRQQLEQRLAAAEQTEIVANVTKLRSAAEATEKSLSTWWIAERQRLVDDLASGVSLGREASDARWEYDRAAEAAAQKYPQQVFQAPTPAPVDAHSWSYDLGRTIGLLDIMPDALDTLLRSGDPRAPGTY